MTRPFFSLLVLLLGAQFLPRVVAAAALAKSEILADNVIYLRVRQVATGLTAEINAANGALASTNKIIGTVLDLRFADGRNVDEARSAADLFASKKLPLAILVDGGTQDSALTLATALRTERAGLIFGSATGDLQPDIAVMVNLNDEKKFLANPYALPDTNEVASLSATNNLLPFIDHTSEADLVRAKVKDGDEDEDVAPTDRPEPKIPVIRDPVLARAVDLLKGLAVVKAAHE